MGGNIGFGVWGGGGLGFRVGGLGFRFGTSGCKVVFDCLGLLV